MRNQYTISRESLRADYEVFGVSDGKNQVAAVFYLLDENKHKTLHEIHVLDPSCSVDKVLEAVKPEGVDVSAFLVVEFPSLRTKYVRG